ncbi:MAG: energy transducer TonB [Candidatus Cloacimonetes bacterium]|nr:energy transducer TonB [Candidatus Cloacimonadota bacterium]
MSVNIKADVRQLNQYPSIVIRASGTDNSDYVLVDNFDHSSIPIIDLSRQFVPPGSYTLSYENWGYHNYTNSFDLEMNGEKIINYNPTPINSRILKRYNNWNKLNRISTLSAFISLGGAGLFKVMGDSEYQKYKNATDTDYIAKFRKNSSTYQTIFYSASSICLSSSLSWFITHSFKKSAKKQVIAEMNKQAVLPVNSTTIFQNDRQVTNSPYDDPPIVIGSLTPEYPYSALRAKQQGTVVLEVEVLKNGCVGRIEVKRSLPDGLDEAAIEAVRKLMFQPEQSSGKPIDCLIAIPVEFKIN